MVLRVLSVLTYAAGDPYVWTKISPLKHDKPIMLLMLLFDERNRQEYVLFYFVALILVVLLSSVPVCYLLGALKKRMRQNRLMEQRLREQYLQYREIEELQQELRELRHDLRNYLAAGAGEGIPGEDI